jgi:hypothetical protein
VSNTLSGHPYTLVCKTNLMDAAWMPLTGLGTAAGKGGTLNLTDANWVNAQAQRFYRIQVP